MGSPVAVSEVTGALPSIVKPAEPFVHFAATRQVATCTLCAFKASRTREMKQCSSSSRQCEALQATPGWGDSAPGRLPPAPCTENGDTYLFAAQKENMSPYVFSPP